MTHHERKTNAKISFTMLKHIGLDAVFATIWSIIIVRSNSHDNSKARVILCINFLTPRFMSTHIFRLF